jgi:hypothetical protein
VENGKTGTHSSKSRIMGNHQLIIITRLLQHVETMQNIDELFTWLSEMMIERMDIQVVQFWSMQGYSNGQAGCNLRTMAQQNTSLPQHVVINQPLADIIEHLLNKRQSVVPQAVKNIFPQYLSRQLTSYNLNYWTCNFMSNSILLPPTKNTFLYEQVPTPLTLAVSAFSQHTPSSRLLPTLSHILEHGLSIARRHGLLTGSPPVERGLQVSNNQSTGQHSALTAFIPYHIPINGTSKEALTGEKSLIQDRNARRLYREIDGQKNIGELTYITQLNTQEFYAALCLLLAQKYIQLFNAEGRQSVNLQSSLRFPVVPRVQ